MGDRLFDHRSSDTPTPSKADHPATPDSGWSQVASLYTHTHTHINLKRLIINPYKFNTD